MGARGPKAKPAEIYQMRGTHERTRHTGGELGHDPEEYVPTPPSWLKGALPRKAWKRKVAEYQRRGQRIEGFEEALADYCVILAKLEMLHKVDEPVPPAMRQMLFKYFALFYDTPADAVAAGPKQRDESNPFGKHGKKP